MFTLSPPAGGAGVSAAQALVVQGEGVLRHEDKTFEDLKILLKKLLFNNIDQFEVLDQANRLAIEVDQQTFSRQKYLLQKKVLEQILKKEETHYYLRLLNETNRNLMVKNTTSKYPCALVGCLFTTDKHWKYPSHLKRVHSTYEHLTCNFLLKCKRQFSSFSALHDHVKTCHSKVKPTVAKELKIINLQIVDCKCDMVSCRAYSRI